MHKFIFEKKLQNQLKYDEKSKLNHYAMHIPKGTISLMLNIKKKSNMFSFNKPKKRLDKRNRYKIKWKTIQWLFMNKRDSVNSIIANGRSIFKKFGMDEDNVNFRLLRDF